MRYEYQTNPMALPNPVRIRRTSVEKTAREAGLSLTKNGRSDPSAWKQVNMVGEKFHSWELVGIGFKRQIFLHLEDVDLFLTNYFHI